MWQLDHKEDWVLKNRCFRIVVLEKTLESLLECKEIKLLLKEINPEYSLEKLMLKLKLQYSDHLTWRADSLKKTLILWKTEGRRRSRWQRMSCLDGITDSMDMSLSKLRETVKDREAWHDAFHGVTKSCTQLSYWTTTTSWKHFLKIYIFSDMSGIILPMKESGILWQGIYII